ncbi:hypothetical protein ACFY19_29510 [Streptosporangium saharense]|uniref:hypothetical protein n=1 Tax=Streptosporangium saharense TaxID=1706840 RepID=UPI0036CAC1F0
MEPVLIMGGSGQAGAGAAAVLRRWHPELPLTLAGRDLDRARKVADGLGAATAVTIDLRRDDLGLPEDGKYSAVVAAVWDSHLNGLRYAQGHGLPYLSISNGLVDLAPEVFAVAQRASAPVLLASHSFAGLAVLAALDAARRFERIDTIRITLILDELDAGGPAAVADLDRLMAATSAGLVRRDGVFAWVDGEEARVEVATEDGVVLPGQTIAIPDVPSVALATGAPNVRFDFAVGESAGRRGGGPASVEVRIDLEGTGPGGTPLGVSRRLAHPEGQRPLTALGIALGVERLLGEPVAPGVHAPEALLDPVLAVERMVDAGTVLTDT